ncbi:hypothetical protein [Rubellimicrobium aerolatum]|uniref:Lipoprotein n=1 Tax=Rubellimicrobium aerolatum TaxID=490979 RepID=A0ABW0S9I8_9RHOB|nr:hypothetical protein [Rubellimicrobium aerolatum]MBP1804971.1 hypothetical protein [Rubellimicrobium aerolatum]
MPNIVPPMLLAAGALLLAACEPGPVDPERAAQVCEQRARGAQGPTGSVTVGASSSDGAFGGVAIGLTGDYLAGRDPIEVYTRCVEQRTGQPPIRPPRLRS